MADTRGIRVFAGALWDRFSDWILAAERIGEGKARETSYVIAIARENEGIKSPLLADAAKKDSAANLSRLVV